jgi:hypothetical protein
VFSSVFIDSASAIPGLRTRRTVTVYVAPVSDIDELAKILHLGNVNQLDAQEKTAWIDVSKVDISESK